MSGILLTIVITAILAPIIRWSNRKTILNELGWHEEKHGLTVNDKTDAKIGFEDLFFKPWPEIVIKYPEIEKALQHTNKKYQPW